MRARPLTYASAAFCLGIAACGGSAVVDSNDLSALSTDTVQLILNGKYNSFYDRVHPEIQARTTESDLTECLRKNNRIIRDVGVAVTQTTSDTHITASGTTIDTTEVTLLMKAHGDQANFALVWTKVGNEWKVVDVPGDDSSGNCLPKL
jgi:hypothetical protein